MFHPAELVTHAQQGAAECWTNTSKEPEPEPDYSDAVVWLQVKLLPHIFSSGLWLCEERFDVIDELRFHLMPSRTISDKKLFSRLQYGYWMGRKPPKSCSVLLDNGKLIVFSTKEGQHIGTGC